MIKESDLVTAGDTRTVVDVALYAVVLAGGVWALAAPGPLIDPVRVLPTIVALAVLGLRDKTIFLAARAEQGLADLRGIARVATTGFRTAGARRLIRFAAIGAVSTAAYVLLYAALRMQLSGSAANTLALLVTAAGNTAANRHLTFGVRGRRRRVRHHLGGIAALLVALGITTAAVDTLDAVDRGASRPLEVAVLVGANLLATVVRYRVLHGVLTPSPPPSRSNGHLRLERLLGHADLRDGHVVRQMPTPESGGST